MDRRCCFLLINFLLYHMLVFGQMLHPAKYVGMGDVHPSLLLELRSGSARSSSSDKLFAGGIRAWYEQMEVWSTYLFAQFPWKSLQFEVQSSMSPAFLDLPRPSVSLRTAPSHFEKWYWSAGVHYRNEGLQVPYIHRLFGDFAVARRMNGSFYFGLACTDWGVRSNSPYTRLYAFINFALDEGILLFGSLSHQAQSREKGAQVGLVLPCWKAQDLMLRLGVHHSERFKPTWGIEWKRPGFRLAAAADCHLELGWSPQLEFGYAWR